MTHVLVTGAPLRQAMNPSVAVSRTRSGTRRLARAGVERLIFPC